MRSAADVDAVFELLGEGLSLAEISRRTGVNRATIRAWRQIGRKARLEATWPCAFPQAGPGPKHKRPIVLEEWQAHIAAQRAGRLVRGLIHSDGCRCINRVKRKAPGSPPYEYPRYFFSNRSVDIQRIFTAACDQVGVQWRQDGPWNISIARRESVELLDLHVGPKR
jgi:hypothetical protein